MWALAFSRVSVFLHLLVTPLVVAQYAALVWWGLPARSHPSPAAWRPPDDEGGGATVLQWVCPHLLAGGGTLLSVGGMVALFVVGVACMRLPPLSQGERTKRGRAKKHTECDHARQTTKGAAKETESQRTQASCVPLPLFFFRRQGRCSTPEGICAAATFIPQQQV